MFDDKILIDLKTRIVKSLKKHFKIKTQKKNLKKYYNYPKESYPNEPKQSFQMEFRISKCKAF